LNELGKYVLVNNNFVKTNEFNIGLYNRSFKYGDGLFETMRAGSSRVYFFDEHMNRLISSMLTLKMQIPENFKNQIKCGLEKLLDRNKLYKGARIRLTVYRNEGGFYKPESNNISYLAESTGLKDENYYLNKPGWHIDFFSEMKKPIHILSELKTTNCLIYVLAGIFCIEKHIDDCVILNTNYDICEFSSSNIFLVYKDKIYTPPLSSGCLNGIMRGIIIKLAYKLNFEVIENALSKELLLQADEVFATNAIKGIQWISAYKNKRYYNKTAQLLINALNKKVLEN